jgi:hypothetical protein
VTTYTDTFSAGQIYAVDVSYKAYTSTQNLTLVWPAEAAPNNNIVAQINDVNFTATGRTITMPSALNVSVGANPMWNNIGANPFTILTATGGTILTATSGGAYFTYLTDNSTEGGTWRTFQLGSGTTAANAADLAGLGLVAITTTLNQQYSSRSTAVNQTLAAADRASLVVWTGGAGTFALTAAPTLGNGWFVNLRNAGTGAVVIDPSAAETINDDSTFTINPGDSAIVICDGTEFWTVGFGQDAVFAFDYTEIDVSGSGNYTLTGTQLNRIAYKFTGILTGARDIIVPSTVQQYWGDNSTTGAFTLGVRTSTQASPGITIANGSTRQILYCNGTNVVLADTAGLSSPIPISQGGTGATTASGARDNLSVYSKEESIVLAIALS